ncbi:hypothetical protein ACROYT_G009723 [Oculina patagonica]
MALDNSISTHSETCRETAMISTASYLFTYWLATSKGVDPLIIMWEGKWHLVTTCHYSDWVEIDVLPKSLQIVQLTKAHFAGLGYLCAITDNGPSYRLSTSSLLLYGFEHVTSSPYWPQGNGKAEAAVKIVKRMYQKKGNLALLDYRNTPQQGQEHSPAQSSYPDAQGAYFQ